MRNIVFMACLAIGFSTLAFGKGSSPALGGTHGVASTGCYPFPNPNSPDPPSALRAQIASPTAASHGCYPFPNPNSPDPPSALVSRLAPAGVPSSVGCYPFPNPKSPDPPSA